MNAKKFSDAMSELDDKYIDEALNYKKKIKKSRKKMNKYSWTKWGAIAACFAVVVVTAVSVLPNYLNQQGTTPPNNSNGVISDNSNDDTQPATTEIRISMSDIIMNQIDGFTSADYARYNPETDDEVVWNKEDIVAYYGSDLTPAYMPNGLVASEQNSNATVYIRQDGTVTEDTIQLGFYQSEDMTVKQGFTITVSKIGIIQTCLYVLPEDEVKTSNIEGTEVTFGYRSMPYGPYNSETHEPAGYYDMYVAEFKHNGVDYQIVAKQMGIEEVVKVVASIITGEKDIAVDEGAYTKNYKDVSELPNTEPNWTDTPDTTSENTANKLETENWEVTIDEGPYMENYEDIPELPNAEPNWIDTPDATLENTNDNLDTENWEVIIDEGPYMENYKDIPELPNAEPNWID